MRKLFTLVSLSLAGILGFAGVAGATTPIVDAEAEATTLFNEHAPTVVGVILLAAGFVVTLKILGAVIRKVTSVLGRV